MEQQGTESALDQENMVITKNLEPIRSKNIAHELGRPVKSAASTTAHEIGTHE